MTSLFLYSVTYRKTPISGERKKIFFSDDSVDKMLEEMKRLEIQNLNPIMRVEIVAKIN